jgi:hypothetical protein
MRSCVVLLVVARSAAAQPSPELTKEFQAGVDAFRLGHYDEARAHLDKARGLDPKLPGPYRFLGAVSQAEGKWQECIDDTRKALELSPQSPEVPETRKLHDECRGSAGKAPYRGPELADSAAISVTTNVPGATVKIGGLVYGGTPLAPRPITAGSLDIAVDKAGWKPAQTTVNALPGIVTDVNFDLEPDPNAKVVGDNPTGAKPTLGYVELREPASIDGKPTQPGRIELPPGTHVVEMTKPGSDLWRRRVRVSAGQVTKLQPALIDTADREHTEMTGFAVLGGAAALLAAGFVTALVSEHAANEARDIQRIESARSPSDPMTDKEPLRTRADFDAARDRASTFGVISDIAIGAGLVAAGVGAYFLYKGEKQPTDGAPPFAIAPVHGGALIARELRW